MHNLGRRDLTAAEVREAQLEEALALGPDLAIVAAGGNDLLRREFDPNMVRDELSAILGPLRAAGADVLTFDLLDNTGTGLVPERFVAVLRERLVQLADATRAASAAVGGWHAPLREHPAAGDADIFAGDGLHLNARGHAIVGTALARHLGAARGGAIRARRCRPRVAACVAHPWRSARAVVGVRGVVRGHRGEEAGVARGAIGLRARVAGDWRLGRIDGVPATIGPGRVDRDIPRQLDPHSHFGPETSIRVAWCPHMGLRTTRTTTRPRSTRAPAPTDDKPAPRAAS